MPNGKLHLPWKKAVCARFLSDVRTNWLTSDQVSDSSYSSSHLALLALQCEKTAGAEDEQEEATTTARPTETTAVAAYRDAAAAFHTH